MIAGEMMADSMTTENIIGENIISENMIAENIEAGDMSREHGELGAPLNEARLELAARGENVALARGLTAAFVVGGWDLTLPVLEEIKVAVSEAVSNAIIHGYGEDPAQYVHIRLRSYQRGLLVEISDSGVGIADVRQAMEPDYTSKPEHLGLGFAFMNTFMDRVRVESAPGRGTRVELVRLLDGRAPEA